jgi:hypothetical protein
MSAEIIDFDGARVDSYIMRAVQGFLNDPPDDEFQRGFLSALVVVYREGLSGRRTDARIVAADRLSQRT